jgi:hypothetical protein
MRAGGPATDPLTGTGADGATTARPPAQKRRRTPGGLAFSEEKVRPDARETPKVRKGHHPGDRPDKATGGEVGKPDSSRRENALEGRKPRGGSSRTVG